MPTFACLLILAGTLLTYGEFIWVGRLIFGVLGALSALAGISILWRMPHTVVGIVLIGCAVAAFLVETVFETRWAAGVLGTGILGLGFWKLCPGEFSISPLVSFPASIVFGFITTCLLSIAKRARRNKSSERTLTPFR